MANWFVDFILYLNNRIKRLIFLVNYKKNQVVNASLTL